MLVSCLAYSSTNREIYNGIKICAKWGGDGLTDFIEQKSGGKTRLQFEFVFVHIEKCIRGEKGNNLGENRVENN
jgi:hypothetical protein